MNNRQEGVSWLLLLLLLLLLSLKWSNGALCRAAAAAQHDVPPCETQAGQVSCTVLCELLRITKLRHEFISVCYIWTMLKKEARKEWVDKFADILLNIPQGESNWLWNNLSLILMPLYESTGPQARKIRLFLQSCYMLCYSSWPSPDRI